MTGVREILEAISDFSDFVQDRAMGLVRAKGYKRRLCLHKIDFYAISVGVTFQEDTSHDCPDYEYVELSLTQLELNDSVWKAYVDNINNDRLKEEAEKSRLVKEVEFAKKEKEYLRLKQELGK